MLLAALVWDDGKDRIVVRAGTSTDLASIPRVLRWLLQQNGLSRRPAVLHDDLYRRRAVPRSEADAIFRRALAAEGMGGLGRCLYWGGVRLGGWVGWWRKQQCD